MKKDNKMIDFFIGKRNRETENFAKKLGFNRLLFVKEVSKLKHITKEDKDNYDAFLIKTLKPEPLRRMIDKLSNYSKPIFVLGTTDEVNRIALEHKKIKALVSPEYNRQRDFLHYRNSGLNQVLCKIARDNNKLIIINFNNILLSQDIKRAKIIGRIIQNIKICKKYKTKIRIASFATLQKEMRSFSDLRSFCVAIGMTKEEAGRVFLFS